MSLYYLSLELTELGLAYYLFTRLHLYITHYNSSGITLHWGCSEDAVKLALQAYPPPHVTPLHIATAPLPSIMPSLTLTTPSTVRSRL
jgi:hypothetical protein